MKVKSGFKFGLISICVPVMIGAFYYLSNAWIGHKTSPEIDTASSWQGNNFKAVDISHARLSLFQLSDRPIVIHFWATWCAPCVNEFPKMIRFIESFKGRIQLVTVSADQSDEVIKSFLKKNSINQAPYIHIIRDDGGKVAKQYMAKMLPTSVILGKGLKVEKRLSGEVDWENPRLKEIFEQLANSKSN